MKNYVLIFFALISINVFSQLVTVTGNVKLTNETEHNNIWVIFNQISPSTSTDTVVTDVEGNYNFSAAQGLYNIDFYKHGFDKVTYKNISIFSEQSLTDTSLSVHRTFLRVPVDFDSVYKAVNYSVSGDTIIISEGTYNENISFTGKSLIIASEFFLDSDTSHISKTILSGGDAHRIIYASNGGETLILSGLTLRDGYIDYYGSALFYSGKELYIEDCHFSDNIAYKSASGSDAQGGAIYCSGSYITILNSSFRNNRSYTLDGGTKRGTGGALFFANLGSGLIKNCIFENNITGENGGGAFALNYTVSGVLKVDFCQFINNKADMWGGAINAGSLSSLIIYNSVFNNNRIVVNSNQGGGAIKTWGRITIESSSFINNYAYDDGAAILTRGNGFAYIDNCMFIGNISNNYILSITSTQNSFVKNSLLAYNSSSTNKGIGTGKISVTNSSFYKNKFTTHGTGIKIINSSIFPKQQMISIDPLIGLLMKTNVNGDSVDFYNNLTGDPLFQDTVSYIPSSSSPQVDAGINDSIDFFADYLGNYRFFDGNNDSLAVVDIGPYEVNSSIIDSPFFSLGNDTAKCAGDTVSVSLSDDYYKTIWLNDTVYGNTRNLVVPGNYYAHALKDGFLLFSDTLVISDYKLPVVEIKKTIEADTLVKLQTKVIYSTYLWNNGSTEASIKIPKSEFASDTLFSWVAVKDNHTCKGTDTISLLKSDFPVNSSASSVNGAFTVKIYPQPAAENLFINFPEANSAPINIDVFDMAGHKVLTQVIPGSNEFMLNISSLKSGYYVLNLGQNDKIISGYILKK